MQQIMRTGSDGSAKVQHMNLCAGGDEVPDLRICLSRQLRK